MDSPAPPPPKDISGRATDLEVFPETNSENVPRKKRKKCPLFESVRRGRFSVLYLKNDSRDSTTEHIMRMCVCVHSVHGERVRNRKRTHTLPPVSTWTTRPFTERYGRIGRNVHVRVTRNVIRLIVCVVTERPEKPEIFPRGFLAAAGSTSPDRKNSEFEKPNRVKSTISE